MPYQPKFKDCFRVETLESEGICLLSERRSLILQDSLHQLLAPLINGQVSIDEIVDEVLPQLLPEQTNPNEIVHAGAKIYHALASFAQKGYTAAKESKLPSQLSIFCDSLNLAPEPTAQKLKETRVALKAFGAVETAAFSSLLKSLHINVIDGTEQEAHLDVVLVDDYLQEELEPFNQSALKSNRPWLLVKPVGTVIWIGPIFYPGRTGCWQCLATRLRANRPLAAYIQKNKGMSTPFVSPQSVIASTLQTALGIAATEILKWIVQGENRRLEGVLVTLDTLSLQMQDHLLVKRPQCLACGEPGLDQQLLPMTLGNCLKKFTADGGHRCLSPKETFEKYQHHLSPIVGLLRSIESIAPPSSNPIHAYFARYSFAMMTDTLDTLCQNLTGGSAGKGMTAQQAKASVLCEGIERYSGVFQGSEPRLKSSYQALEDKAIHPNLYLQFSQVQYDSRQASNAQTKSFIRKVPEPFDETEAIDWTPVWSLTKQDWKYLPTAYCYFNYPKSSNPYCWADSNGCASGNSLEEAILHGFMELVERDSIALWWYNRLSKPKVDLDSFEESYFQDLQEYHQTLHRKLWVLDITSDLGIPTFAAISRRTDRDIEDIILGFGAHFDAKIAVSRALTEVNQILPAVLHSATDGSTLYSSSSNPSAVEWWKIATIENQPYLLPDPSVVPKRYFDYSQSWSNNLLDDIVTCQQIVEDKGMEMLILDQTRPDIGLKVVRVTVPGMRHYWKRLGPGRLYDVPVQMGWLPAPLKESQLNPIAMWM